jgi:hypothetical protein
MASAPQSLPIFYNDLVPLSSVDHQSWRGRPMANMEMLRNAHAVPITVDEFLFAQRAHPIVFTLGESPLPIALFGLNEGINVFLTEDGKLTPEAYLPAYVRRYPFMLAKLRPDSEDLSLCFDPSSGLIGEFDDGVPIFTGGEPSTETKGTLEFCEQFELGAQRTSQFMRELSELGLLEEGEMSLQVVNNEAPYIYRGFQMVNEEKLKKLRGDQLRKIMQNGMLPLLHAHLFSLTLMSSLFQRQLDAGLVPPQQLPN